MKRPSAWLIQGLLAAVAGLFWQGCGSDKSDGNPASTGGSAGDGAGGYGAGLAGLSGDIDVSRADNLGQSCARDEQCGDNLRCVTADSGEMGGEGPPGGFCTIDCQDHTDCEELGSALCIDFDRSAASPAAFCLPTCEPGSDAEEKCGGRVPGAACLAFEQAEGDDPWGACFPQCQSDEQCGGGMFCNPKSGLCADEEEPGDPSGSACTIDPVTDLHNCEGYCVPVVDEANDTVFNLCTDTCVVGWPCGMPDVNKPADGVCVPEELDGTVGDLGWCSQLCDCDFPCRHPELVCSALGEDEARVLHRAGICLPPDPEDEWILDCSGGAGGGAGAAGADGEPAAGAGGGPGADVASGGEVSGEAGAAPASAGGGGRAGAEPDS